MTLLLDRVKAVYDEADHVASLNLPYVFSGGHNVLFAPSLGYAQGIDARGAGYDCSSGASVCLRAGGLLANPRAVFPLDTHAFELYGFPGVGRWLTLWVRNDWVQQHCFLDFHGDPYFRHRWWQAANPHMPPPQVGWINAATSNFQPRHWPNT